MKKKRTDTSNELDLRKRSEIESNVVAETRIARERKFRKVMDEINKKYANVFRRLSE